MIKYIIIFVFSFLSLTANASMPLASFADNEVITIEDLEKYVSTRIDLGGTFKNTYAVENSLGAMILTRLLVLEGVEKSVARFESNTGNDRYDDKYAFSVFRSLSASCLPLKNEGEAKAFFEKNPEVFRMNTTTRLFRYMLPKDQMVNGKDAQTTMLDWAKGWSVGKFTLDQIGGDASKLYNVEVQGDIGWLQLSDEVQLMRAIDSAKIGELVGPVLEGDFVYLFYVSEKHQGRQLQWDEVKNQVSKMAESYCVRKNAESIKNSLYAKYGVKIDRENIKKIFSLK